MRVLRLNHRVELDRSTLDLDTVDKKDRSMLIDVSVTETNSIAQYVPRVRVLHA